MKLKFDNATKPNKKFGITISIVLGIISVWHYFKNPHLYIYFVLASLAIMLISIIYPVILTIPRKFWEKLGHILGLINTYILLTLIFFLLLFPLSLLMKLFNKDSLGRKFHPEISSYWGGKSIPGNSKMQF